MRGLVLLVLCFVLAVAGQARADLPPPPEYTACDALQEGDECAGGGVSYGECVPDTCTRLTYPPDGGTPTSTEYDCLYCEARPAPEDDEEGCAVRRVGAAGSGWLAVLAVPALFMLLLRRRRR
jgi:hypothetical protein